MFTLHLNQDAFAVAFGGVAVSKSARERNCALRLEPAEIIACKHFFGVRHEPQERLLLFLFVVFTERPSDRIRIISARPATQEENDEYYKNYDAR